MMRTRDFLHSARAGPAAWLNARSTAIKAAQRPVIVADRGVIVSGASAALAQFRGTRSVPGRSHARRKTRDARRPSSFFAARSDSTGAVARTTSSPKPISCIYAGSNTSDHTTANWTMPKQGTAIIQIDIDPLEIGRNYPGVIGMLVRRACSARSACDGRAPREARRLARATRRNLSMSGAKKRRKSRTSDQSADSPGAHLVKN